MRTARRLRALTYRNDQALEGEFIFVSEIFHVELFGLTGRQPDLCENDAMKLDGQGQH